MKKNILIVQSLLILPLIISSVALSMEISDNTTNDTELKQTLSNEEIEALQPMLKEHHIPTINELTQRFKDKKNENEHNSIQNEPIDVIEQPKILNLTSSETEIINVSMPEYMLKLKDVSTDTSEIPSALFQSVILPTEIKELTFFEKFSYHTSTANQLLNKMIYYLKNDQFDVKNLTHFKWLYEAIETATANKDCKSLATIATLCHDKYATTIRIPEKVAQPAAEVLHAHYSTELGLANQILQNKRQEQMQQWNIKTAACVKAINEIVNAYNQNVKAITDNFDTSVTQEAERIKNLRREISTFSSLNREIRQGTAELLQSNQIQAPKNIFAKTMGESQKRLNDLTTTINEMPTIKNKGITENDFKSKSDQLALQNK